MNRLFKFELKRLQYRKIFISILILMIFIGGGGVLLGQIFSENMMGDDRKFLWVVQAFNQFVFIFLSYVYIQAICEDYQTQNYTLYRLYGLSVKKSLFAKYLYMYLVTVLTAAVLLFITSLIFKPETAILLPLSIAEVAIGVLFTCIFSLVLSLIFKKTLTATVVNFIFFMVFNVLNTVAYGLVNPADTNSFNYAVLSLASAPEAFHHLSISKMDYSMLMNHPYRSLLIGGLIPLSVPLLLLVILFVIGREKK